MTKGFFITGTDTNIGKTIASCALLHTLSQQGFKVAGMKPIASGAELNSNIDSANPHSKRPEGILQNEDALALIEHSNVPLDYQQVNPYCFKPAIAPHLAAQQAKIEIAMPIIEQAYAELSKQVDWVIVEGVGGWRVPINPQQCVADIALQLKLPVILVVGMKLGCINHALLTIESIKAAGIPLKGWIANQIDPEMQCYEQTIKTLQNKMNTTYLGSLPYFNKGRFDPEQNNFTDLNL